MPQNKFSYRWLLKDGYPQSNDGSVLKNNYNVFGTFINAGGSTMGYKLAGYNHLGGVEIDDKTASDYKRLHNPKYLFIEDIRDFLNREDIPRELYDLDILDGSPPCTTFSINGLKKESQGINKKFAEGNKFQVLDTLVFEYAKLIIKLKPKVFLFENVAGFVSDIGKAYFNRFILMLRDYYTMQAFLINGASMGLPQSRKRCFIIGYKKEYNLPKIDLTFNEKIVPFSEICDHTDTKKNISDRAFLNWSTGEGASIWRFESKIRVFSNKPLPTFQTRQNFNAIYPRRLNKKEILLGSSYPLDFDCKRYVFYCGMGVPPLMIANISLQIKEQWLDKIYNEPKC